MTIYGARPDELAHLGRTLQHQRDPIQGVIQSVSSVLAGTTWMGPARDRFEHEWNSSFRQALTNLNEAFELAGLDCIQRAAELQRVMGAG